MFNLEIQLKGNGLKHNPVVLLFYQLLKLKKKCNIGFLIIILEDILIKLFLFVGIRNTNICIDSDIQYNFKTICIIQNLMILVLLQF